MTEHAVIVAGGGPTGLMLAAELALAGVDVAVVERRATQDLTGSRAGGLSARTLEVFDQRGIADRFVAEGQVFQVTGFAMARLDISDFPTRFNHGLALWQNHIERIMAAWVREMPVTFYRSRDVTAFAQHDDFVNVTLSDDTMLRAQYLVGCDGGRSTVRKLAGIEFPGWDATVSNIIAEVDVTEEPPLGVHHTAAGTHAFGRAEYEIRDGKIIYKDSGPLRVMITESRVGAAADPTLDEVRAALIELYGNDFGVRNPTWITRVSDNSRQAAAYRRGRVLLAGDAAHVHSPIGGQGLNTGVQDAVNLGWKLAQVVRGTSPDALLDTYHAERHPVGARVLQLTMAQVALHRTDERSKAAGAIVAELMKLDEPRKQLAAELSQLGIHYDFGAGHPLLGRRMPDLDVTTQDGATRVYSLLRDARHLVLYFDASMHDRLVAWNDRVQVLACTYAGAWELPAIGAVAAPSAVLVRPDGYVAWVGAGSDDGLTEALARWCGEAMLPR